MKAAPRFHRRPSASNRKTPPFWNAYAWFLATCPDDKGHMASQCRRMGDEGLAQWQNDPMNGIYLDTLAAVYARNAVTTRLP